MEWFKNLSTGNKIAISGLVVSILGFILALTQFYKSPPNQDSPHDKNAVAEVEIKTEGKNSPIVNNTKGNVKISFGEEDEK